MMVFIPFRLLDSWIVLWNGNKTCFYICGYSNSRSSSEASDDAGFGLFWNIFYQGFMYRCHNLDGDGCEYIWFVFSFLHEDSYLTDLIRQSLSSLSFWVQIKKKEKPGQMCTNLCSSMAACLWVYVRLEWIIPQRSRNDMCPLWPRHITLGLLHDSPPTNTNNNTK